MINRLPLLLMLMAALLALSGCAEQPITPGVVAGPDEIAAQYRLGPGDQVRITVFNQTNLSGEFTLDGAGFIALPLVGPVKAGGKTSRELEQAIVGELTRAGYLVNPKVAAQISLFRPYYILGEVGQPGAYPYTASLTVRKAVAAARGFTYRANTNRVYIQRAADDDEYLYELTPALIVLPGDTIRIPERLF